MTPRRQAIRYRPILRDPPVIVVGEHGAVLPIGAVLLIAVGLFLLCVAVVMGVLRWGLG